MSKKEIPAPLNTLGASVTPQVTPAARARLIEYLINDAEQRHRYQHEFSLAGFKTLILMNGGAIIALLTYIGHAPERHINEHLSWAFIGYVVGLVSVVLAYLAAYFSQGSFLQATAGQALMLMEIESEDKTGPDTHGRRGNIAIAMGVFLCVLSLAAFITGSWCAMRALT